MGKIKVLYIVSTLRSSGPTNQLLGKISNLDKKKFEAKVLTLSPDPSNNRRDDFVAANIELDSLNLSRVQFQLKGKTLLKQYISAYNPDIVHTTGVRADIAVSKLKVESKHCMTIRNYAFDDYVAKYGNFIGKKAAKSSIKAMQKCEYVICCSKSLKEMYSKILPQELFVVQNGVDTIKYAPLDKKESKINLRESLALPIDKVILTAVGSLIKRKDPITIINAFKNANKENNAVLLLLGDGDLMEECKKIADN
ncbi:glycosyltransferase, partial [Alkalibacter mobilis]|uniref:glycosyltransferase n=1 Tax=Alkalibacter mobilis TaxID=2787712 RepID=UPI0018A0D643